MAQLKRGIVRLLATVLLLLSLLITLPGQSAAKTRPGQLQLADISGSSPSASWTNNGARVDVFGRGTDGRLYQKFWTAAGGWQGWFGFAAPAAGIGSSPSVTWADNGSRVDVFVTGNSDGHLYQKFWTSSAGWSNWVDLN
jgi:hypothetical protein